MIHLLEHWLGLTNASGMTYLWWSGFFADVTLFGAGVTVYRKHNCHVQRCWRLGHHEVRGSTGEVYKVCRPHHPTVPKNITVQDVHDAHRSGLA